jgi:K+-transporting ATPase ATPase C chain
MSQPKKREFIMKTQLAIAIKFLLVMSILTGIVYPFLMTGLAQIVFPGKANGSLVIKDGILLGSRLIGQKFDSTIYFSSRPSSIDYNPVPSSGSNLGPTSEKLKTQVLERRRSFAIKNVIADSSFIPGEMLFASASGLDPHISPESAYFQLNRVAVARNSTKAQREQIRQLIENKTEESQFTILGERRINVFELNLDLDKIR